MLVRRYHEDDQRAFASAYHHLSLLYLVLGVFMWSCAFTLPGRFLTLALGLLVARVNA